MNGRYSAIKPRKGEAAVAAGGPHVGRGDDLVLHGGSDVAAGLRRKVHLSRGSRV